MLRIIRLLTFINVWSAGIAAGGQLFVLLVIVPVKRQWPQKNSVELHQAMLHDLADRILLPATIISAVTAGLLLLLNRIYGRAVAPLYLVGLLGSAGVAITSERFNKPTNRMILTWSSDAVPESYPQIRDRWDRVHTVRTVSGMLSFVAYLRGALRD